VPSGNFRFQSEATFRPKRIAQGLSANSSAAQHRTAPAGFQTPIQQEVEHELFTNSGATPWHGYFEFACRSSVSDLARGSLAWEDAKPISVFSNTSWTGYVSMADARAGGPAYPRGEAHARKEFSSLWPCPLIKHHASAACVVTGLRMVRFSETGTLVDPLIGGWIVSFRQGCVKRKSDRKQDYRRLD